jgi:hypothetical protein
MTDKMTRGRNPRETLEDVTIAAKQISGPVFGAQELSQRLTVGQTRVLQRLAELEEKRILESKKISGTNVFWFNDR